MQPGTAVTGRPCASISNHRTGGRKGTVRGVHGLAKGRERELRTKKKSVLGLLSLSGIVILLLTGI